MLIRWIGVEIRIFAYFKNLALIGCFVGLGAGLARPERPRSLLWSLGAGLLLAILVQPWTGFKHITDRLAFQDSFVWSVNPQSTSATGVALGLLETAVLFALLAAVLFPLGQHLGAIFEASEHRLRDYSINVAASLAGILAFAALGALSTPPPAWFAVGLLPLLCLADRRAIGILAVAATVLLAVPRPDAAAGDREIRWSPYQKLSLYQHPNYYWVAVNDTGFFWMVDLSAESPYNHYNLVYRFRDAPGDVLVVGAGGGNDVAAALREGAPSVDAVEIDPVAVDLGRRYHPEHPYDDPRVRITVDDARSYFRRCTRRYDTIVFGLLDAHTLTSNFSNVGLDSYVYTRESLQAALRLLKPEGHLAVSFEVQQRPWLARRLWETVRAASGALPVLLNLPPILTFDTATKYYVVSGPRDQFERDGVLQRFQVDPATLPPAEPTTDDWPYLYLQGPGIPTLTLLVLAVVLGATIVASLRSRPAQLEFFLLGAGFLLLETHLVSRGALAFGSTWQVNAAVIGGVLLMILSANAAVAVLRPRSLLVPYAGLAIALGLQYAVPVQNLGPMPFILLGTLPVLFSGTVFAMLFQRSPHPSSALGWNLLGAVAGGMLEATSTAFGLRATVLLALAIYSLSTLVIPRR